MNILHICPSFDNPLYSEITDRQLKNNRVRVFFFQSRKEKREVMCSKDYVDEVHPFGEIDRFFFFVKEQKCFNEIEKLYGAEKFDICHAHTLFTSGYLALKIKRKYGVPYVVAVRGTDINVFLKYRVYLRKVGMDIIENAEKVIFISNTHKTQLLTKYVPKNKQADISRKACVIHNGIDSFWLNNAKDKEIYPETKTINVIYYGDIDRNKNIETTISACKELISRGYTVNYYVIGKIKEKKYEKLLQSTSFVRYVNFSPKEIVIDFLRKSDVFIMPSFSETFGLAYVESMSQGVPIIYSKGQGFDDVFQEGEVGYHVDPYSKQDIVDAVLNICADYSHISKRCVKHCQQFNWDSVTHEYEAIYSCIVGR